MDVEEPTVGRHFIHYEPDLVMYGVTSDELDHLKESIANIWKDVTLVLLSLGIPTLVNAIHETTEPFVFSIALFLNYLIGTVSLVLASVFGLAWFKTSGKTKAIIGRIKAKPRHEIKPSSTNVGALPPQSGIAGLPQNIFPTNTQNSNINKSEIQKNIIR